MLGWNPWSAAGVVVLAFVVARLLAALRIGGDGVLARLGDQVARALASRWAPAVFGILTAAATWYVWGSLSQSSVIHDETAYLLQARLFSHLRWTGPARPLPAFFEQMYVLVSPVLASKYPPGMSLVLVPGVLLGLPGLPVVVLNGLSGALAFALARRLGGVAAALLTWALWITSFPVLYFHAMYLSEVPTSFAWLLAWWGLLRWREGGRARDLTITAAAVGLCTIARPLTGVALALPVLATVVVILVRRARAGRRIAWRSLAPALAVGAIAIAVIPLWNWRTTGNVRLSPLAEYTQRYVPFDKPGFGATKAERPSAELPWDQRVTSVAFYIEHAEYTLARLPKNAVFRLRFIAHDMFYDWRAGLAVFALVGLFVLPGAAWVAFGAFVLQWLLYLSYAHDPSWTLYYSEGMPLLAFLAALGIGAACRRVLRVGAAAQRLTTNLPERALPAVAAALVLLAVVPGARTVAIVRGQIAGDHQLYDGFRALVRQIPDRRAIVFVRYAKTHNDGLALIRNVPFLGDARVWTVYDRGADDARLLALAPDRTPYLFDEASWKLEPLAAAQRAEATEDARQSAGQGRSSE